MILIRHAESENNATASTLKSDLSNYDSMRKNDPALTEFGFEQSQQLVSHEILESKNLRDLSKAGRVRMFTSPMRRAILTSIPLAAHLGLRVSVHPSIVEHGGCYDWIDPVGNVSQPGSTREQLMNEFGSSHNFDLVDRRGWWFDGHQACAGKETTEYFEKRVEQARQWLIDEAWRFKLQHQAGMPAADHLVLVSHGLFLNHLLIRLLQLPEYLHTSRCFYLYNCSVSVLEIDFLDEGILSRESDRRSHPIIRVRTINSTLPSAIRSDSSIMPVN